MKKKPVFVKIPRSFSICFAVFIIVICSAFLISHTKKNEQVDAWFISQLGEFKQDLTKLKWLADQKAPAQQLKTTFATARASYKKLAVLLEYFNPYETKFLNGPALPRVEDDNPDIIFAPRGLQLLEEKIFSEEQIDFASLSAQIELTLATVKQLEEEKERKYKFRNESVMDALTSSLIRLMASGITGFDSPVAQQSITEAVATIEGMESVFSFFKDDVNAKNKEAFDSVMNLYSNAKKYLQQDNDFNSFDRLSFITAHINPLYAALTKLKNETGYYFTEGRRPVNGKSVSIFSPEAFNISFFSPDESYQVTKERVELGKKLFFDPILSSTGQRSCASCHKPEMAFADGLAVALSIDETTSLKRNTPTLWNSVLQTKQFWDSRTDVLENQLDEVVHNAEEMKGSLKQSVDDLKKHPVYGPLFTKAYSNDKEPITAYNIANAISSYIRTLVAMNSRFDQYVNGNSSVLNEDEKKGFNLFAGKAKCATCHFIPLFNGLVPPLFSETESEVIGVPQQKKKKVLDGDLGKYNFTKAEVHRFAFKTPTLRNIALTAPYMHNGVFKTLDEVMNFYNKGGGKGLKIAPENQTLPFDKLNLTKKEIKLVIAFMKTLNDTVYTYRNSVLN